MVGHERQFSGTISKTFNSGDELPIPVFLAVRFLCLFNKDVTSPITPEEGLSCSEGCGYFEG